MFLLMTGEETPSPYHLSSFKEGMNRYRNDGEAHSPTRSMTRTWSPRMLSVIGMICS